MRFTFDQKVHVPRAEDAKKDRSQLKQDIRTYAIVTALACVGAWWYAEGAEWATNAWLTHIHPKWGGIDVLNFILHTKRL
jgi:hypothetical protein